MQQWAAPHDGKGEWIANAPVAGAPPNWFRPSYRTRPVRAWFHLRADAMGETGREMPRAIALLAPIHDRTLRILGIASRRQFIAALTVHNVVAARPAEEWFPYGAGCFGAEIVLACKIH